MHTYNCTRKSCPTGIDQNKKSKIFDKFFNLLEKKFLELHYSESSQLGLAHPLELPVYQSMWKNASSETKTSILVEAALSRLVIGDREKAQELLEEAVWIMRANKPDAEKQLRYDIKKKLNEVEKEFLDKGLYEFLDDAFELEANMITHYESEEADRLADLAQKASLLEKQRWSVIKMISFAFGFGDKDSHSLIDILRYLGDFKTVKERLENMLSNGEHKDKTERMKSIVARLWSLQDLREELVSAIHAKTA